MAKNSKTWRLIPSQQELREKLSKSLGISAVVAQILINRGISCEQEARSFLSAEVEKLGNPFALKDMDKAVQRILLAIKSRQKITIYGDYDVDGITSCAILYKLLKRLGAVVDYYIPDRQSEGYGLNTQALEHLLNQDTKLVITVDCGISSLEEIAAMAGKMDIIITDHHQPPECIPAATAVINPKRSDCPYPDKQLAGVGVVFKLCQALWNSAGGLEKPFIDDIELAAIGTIADIVPLIGENRLLVKLGLERLSQTKNRGLLNLIDVCNFKGAKLDAGKVGFALAPRLNAAGRVGHAAIAVELLVTEDDSRAREIAQMLDAENCHRQTLEKQILETCEQTLAAKNNLFSGKVLVVEGENWHPGVIGIVASRLVDKYYRPTVVISISEGIGKGSCRSIPGFDIYEALSGCGDLLIKFGGHKQAAGLTIAADKIEEFRRRLGDMANHISEETYRPVINIDTLVSLEQVNAALLEQIACLAPHGMGNPAPVFACRDLQVTDFRAIGQEGKHLKLRVRRQNSSGDVIGWGMGELAGDMHRNETIDLVFAPEFNEWQGHRNIQLKALDLRKTIK